MGVIPGLRLFGAGGSSGPDWLKNWSSRSWLLSDLLGDTASRIICAGLFLAAFIGFIGAALGLLGVLVPHQWWRTLAVAAAVISLVALALFWKAFVLLFPHKVGNIGVNIAVLVCLLRANWPMEADIGF
jgi:hypothetical protein